MHCYLVSLVVISALLNSVYSLQCYQCSSFGNDPGDCMTLKGLNPVTCQDDTQDTCEKIVTNIEAPNNGPQDRMKDNSVTTYLSRGCATKETFEHFSKVDERCDDTFIGGGGSQQRCLCSGNSCNTASHVAMGTATVFLSAIAALLY